MKTKPELYVHAAELLSQLHFQASRGDCAGDGDLVVETLSAPCETNPELCDVILLLKPAAWSEDTHGESHTAMCELHRQMLDDTNQTRGQREAVASDLATLERTLLPAGVLAGMSFELAASRGTAHTVRKVVTDFTGRAVFRHVHRKAFCRIRANFGQVIDLGEGNLVLPDPCIDVMPPPQWVSPLAATTDSARRLEVRLADTGISLRLDAEASGCRVELKTDSKSENQPAIQELVWAGLRLRIPLKWERLDIGSWLASFAIDTLFDQIARHMSGLRIVRAASSGHAIQSVSVTPDSSFTREHFIACWRARKNGECFDELRDELDRNLEGALEFAVKFAQIELAGGSREFDATVPGDHDLVQLRERVCSETKNRFGENQEAMNALPLNLLRDLHCELWQTHEDESGENPQWSSTSGGVRSGKMHEAVASVSLLGLFVENRTAVDGQPYQDGIIARFRFELVPTAGVVGVLYPAPALSLVKLQHDFRNSLDGATECVGDLGLWLSGFDVRWQIERLDGLVVTELRGSSAGAAFMLGILRLMACVIDRPENAPEIWTDLVAIDLQEFTTLAVTAELSRQETAFALKEVGGFFFKTGGQFANAVDQRTVRTLLVAKDQDEECVKAFRVITIPAVLPVDAVCALRENTAPRRAVRRHILEHGAKMRLPLRAPVNFNGMLFQKPVLQEWNSPHEDGAVRRCHTLEEAFDLPHIAVSKSPRFVLLGEPGMGKSTVLEYLAWCAAGDARPGGRYWIPVRIKLGPWAEEWKDNPQESFEDFLERTISAEPAQDRPNAAMWRTWLTAGDVFLLLDGLDEIDGDFCKHVAKVVGQFKASGVLVTCRLNDDSAREQSFSTFPVFEIQQLTPHQRKQFVMNWPAKHPAQFTDNRQQLLRWILTPGIEKLSTVPLLLSIMCLVCDGHDGATTPKTRTELFDKATENFLSRSR